jgi:putative toxin-antitoxin system antitoxin component (TIGR02293 family)
MSYTNSLLEPFMTEKKNGKAPTQDAAPRVRASKGLAVQPPTASASVAQKALVPPAKKFRSKIDGAAAARTTAYNFQRVFLAAPHDRIATIKRGIPAAHIGVLAVRMAMPKEFLIDTLRLSRATLSRRVREKKPLSQDESERVLGVDYLIGQVENMVAESGTPAGFDAAKWVSAWLNTPLPALENKKPSVYMDTVEGQKLVSNILAMAQSGAYA